MSVDPFVAFMGNSQAINPYSYGMNNPLSGTDPTGYTWEYGYRPPQGFNSVAAFGAYLELHHGSESEQAQWRDSMDPALVSMGDDINVGVDAAVTLVTTGSLVAVQEVLSKRSIRKRNGSNNQASTKTDNTADIGSQASKNSNQDMVDNIVEKRRATEAPGDATFAQGRDGDGNLTKIRQSNPGDTSTNRGHAEKKVLADLEGKPKPHTIAVDQTPCSSCTGDLSSANVDKVIVPQQPGKPEGASPKSAAIAAASRGKVVIPKVVQVSGRIESNRLRDLEKQ
nr:hypothetical protein [Thalassotalea sp. PS06]